MTRLNKFGVAFLSLVLLCASLPVRAEVTTRLFAYLEGNSAGGESMPGYDYYLKFSLTGVGDDYEWKRMLLDIHTTDNLNTSWNHCEELEEAEPLRLTYWDLEEDAPVPGFPRYFANYLNEDLQPCQTGEEVQYADIIIPKGVDIAQGSITIPGYTPNGRTGFAVKFDASDASAAQEDVLQLTIEYDGFAFYDAAGNAYDGANVGYTSGGIQYGGLPLLGWMYAF